MFCAFSTLELDTGTIPGVRCAGKKPLNGVIAQLSLRPGDVRQYLSLFIVIFEYSSLLHKS